MMTTQEVILANKLTERVAKIYGPHLETWTVERYEDPWLAIKIERSQPHDALEPHTWMFYMWRLTKDVYVPDYNGAINGDPVDVPLTDASDLKDFIDASATQDPLKKPRIE